MPRWLLIILWGVLILTIVDGGYLVYLSLYSINEYAHAYDETKQYQQSLNGPVLSLLIEILDVVESFIERHEKFFIVFSTIAIAAFTATLWRATSGLFRMAERQAEDMKTSLAIAKQSADAAIESNKLNRDIFIADQRPWVPVEILGISGPLITDKNELHFTLNYRLKNTGKTPALHVKFDAEAIPIKIGIDPNAELRKMSKRIADSVPVFRRLPMGPWGIAVFPGDPKIGTLMSRILRAPFDDLIAKHPTKNTVEIYVLACVTYGFTFDESIHQTGAVYAIVGSGNTGINLDASPIAVEIRAFPPSPGFAT